MEPPSRTIGVFDSGVGGLTVVRSIHRRCPDVDILYLGDTARVPYGTKSASVVQRYAVNCAHFLAEHGATEVVIACNTASAFALERLREEFSFPITGVIVPGARCAAELSTSGRIGVIATEGTIRSGSYQHALGAARPGLQVSARACPLFVPLAEEGLVEHPATRVLARDYLTPLLDDHIDTLVLGCTHYPLLAPLLQDIVGPEIALVDSGSAAALSLRGQNPSSDTIGRMRFFATDVSERVQRVGSAFLGCPMPTPEWVDL